MADIGTMTTTERPDGSGPPPPDTGRRIRRARGLPGSRAVVGALLVTAAAVGVFAAYLNATATPDTSYVVVQGDVPIGTVLTESLLTDTTRFGLVAIDLPAELAANAVPADEALGLEGLRTTAPLTAGDLLSRTALADASVDDDVVALSFEVDVARAVAGSLEPGERVDVAVTYGQGGDAYTLYVARNVLLSDITAAGGGLDGEALILTLAVPDDERVLALVQAFNTGQVVVSRAAAGAGDDGSSVPAYAPPGTTGDATPVPSEPSPSADDADAEG
jgi:Flp pilus assembly protein CpaB